MLPFAKRDIREWGSRYEAKVINREILIRFRGLEYFSKYAENPHIYQAPECNLLLLVELGHLKHCSMYTYILEFPGDLPRKAEIHT